MGSTQRGTVYQVVKTNKVGSKVAVSAHKGTEVSYTTPHRGHGYVVASSQRGAAVSVSSPSHRKSEAAQSCTSDYPRPFSPQSGPSLSSPRGTETRPRSEASRQTSPHRKSQQTQMAAAASHSVSIQRNVSSPREEATRKSTSLAGRENSYRSSLPAGARATRRLSFLDQKDNLEGLQEQEPPSKVQNPQGVRIPRKISVHPKDEAVQTDPIRRTLTAADIRSPRRPASPEHSSSRSAEPRTAQRRIPGQEPEVGPRSSIYSEAKALNRNANLESSLKFSILRDLDSGHRVSMRTDPESAHKYSVYAEPKTSTKVIMSSGVESNMRSSTRGDSESGRRVTISSGGQSVQTTQRATVRAAPESSHKSSIFVRPARKPSVHVELELTPRPLPPRSLPRYGPDSSWWALLNPELEMPQSRPTTPDFEPKSPVPLDSFLSFFEMDSSPVCEDLMFQRENASPSPPSASPPPAKESPNRAPLREVPQAPKHTSKQPIQRFSAFFLDVSEEMYNRVIWWLKGL
uniref:Septin 4 n=1 Tax=Loxodonta africana TaxID=9785 RepID=G3TV94_LOXAF